MNRKITAALCALLLCCQCAALRAQCPTDTVPPELQLYNGLGTTLLPEVLTVTLYGIDFIDTVSDDCTPQPDLSASAEIRLVGSTDTLYADSIVLDCNHLGTTLLEVRVQDAAGNVTSGVTYVLVSVTTNYSCEPQENIYFVVKDGIQSCVTLDDLHLTCSPLLPGADSIISIVLPPQVPVTDSCVYMLDPDVLNNSASSNCTLKIKKNTNWLNGVTASDLVAIRRHILGIELLTNPLQLAAADVNNSGTVTTLDMVLIRRLILGIDTEIAGRTSWHFLLNNAEGMPSGSFISPTPNAEGFYRLHYSLVYLSSQLAAVKLGDVNFSADPTQ